MASLARVQHRLMLAALCVAAALSAACATVSENPPVTDYTGHRVSTLIPNKTYNITPGLGLSAENIVIGAAIYWIVDPLAPNWQLKQTPLGGDRVRIALRKKRFASGGDGEAPELFARHAEQLAHAGGYAGYTVMEYTEPADQKPGKDFTHLDADVP